MKVRFESVNRPDLAAQNLIALAQGRPFTPAAEMDFARCGECAVPLTSDAEREAERCARHLHGRALAAEQQREPGETPGED